MSMQRVCLSPESLKGDFEPMVGLFKALADPHRLAILSALAREDGEVCVCDFTAGLPLNQPTVSHHLKILRDCGLVTSERRGTWVYYQLAPDARQRLADALDAVVPLGVLA